MFRKKDIPLLFFAIASCANAQEYSEYDRRVTALSEPIYKKKYSQLKCSEAISESGVLAHRTEAVRREFLETYYRPESTAREKEKILEKRRDFGAHLIAIGLALSNCKDDEKEGSSPEINNENNIKINNKNKR